MRVLTKKQKELFDQTEKANKTIFEKIYQSVQKGIIQKIWLDGYNCGVYKTREMKKVSANREGVCQKKEK